MSCTKLAPAGPPRAIAVKPNMMPASCFVIFDPESNTLADKIVFEEDFPCCCQSISVINSKLLFALCYKGMEDNNTEIILIERRTGKILNSISGLKRSIFDEDKSNSDSKSFFHPEGINCINNSLFVADTGNSRILQFELKE